MEKLRLGIIGIGNMGSSHALNIKEGKCPEIEITAIADTNAERLEWAKEQGYGKNVSFFTDDFEMLDSGLIDACLIAVPHYDHTTLAIECMKRSIHVMLEKPAGVYAKQVVEMNEEAEKHPEVVFGMMFNQRTNCVYRKLKELVSSGKYGEIRRTNWIITTWYRPQNYYNSGGWRATWAGEGGGVLLNQCPHQLDLWQWICGMPVKVQAHLHYGKWHDIEVEDDVTAYVEYPNGATGVFVTSTGDARGTNRFEIQMDKARFIVENDKLIMDEYEMTEQEFSRTIKDIFGVIGAETKEVETDGENPQHVGVLNAWADAILHGGKLIAEGKEGINGLTISNAMHLSSFLGREVTLPLDNELYYEELMKRVATSKKKDFEPLGFADSAAVMGSTKS
ncbi:MAG: Gfo/Idh/MocA family oxidoreductase [Acutalibacteraceae bacterium]|nr:Gfo/Idh/MocA family oxidoreductase [Acutalibacteraceae bacterium]